VRPRLSGRSEEARVIVVPVSRLKVRTVYQFAPRSGYRRKTSMGASSAAVSSPGIREKISSHYVDEDGLLEVAQARSERIQWVRPPVDQAMVMFFRLRYTSPAEFIESVEPPVG
jgi:hypothetical protein